MGKGAQTAERYKMVARYSSLVNSLFLESKSPIPYVNRPSLDIRVELFGLSFLEGVCRCLLVKLPQLQISVTFLWPSFLLAKTMFLLQCYT